MTKRVIFPGTFDPMTWGHVDMLARAAQLFAHVIVGVANSPSKAPLFTLAERIALAEAVCAPYANVQVVGFGGMLLDFAKAQHADVLLRGVRGVVDFEYELQLANLNRTMCPTLETVFLTPKPEHNAISASLVREIARHGGDAAAFVPPLVAKALVAKVAAH
ncbi:MAG: pantetheine-phosphate adenylyltransferase [Aeromonas sp.]